MTANAIEFRDLSKEFPTKGGLVRALDRFSLVVSPGEFVCLLGPSGCGKTTALRCLAGFEPPTSGTLWINGKGVTSLPPHEREIPLVFQNYALFPHLTIFGNIAYGLRLKKFALTEIQARVREVMRTLSLSGVESRYPDELSGGQQQRVALARALVVRPKILLFDEPLSNLDAQLRLQMRVEIKRLQESLGITCLYVTHDQEEAMSLADRIVIMRSGQIEQTGRPEEIYEQPRTRFVAEFIGHANFLSGAIRRIEGSRCWVEVLGQECLVSLNDQGTSFRAGDTASLMIRHESLLPTNGNSLLKGRIEHRLYRGDSIFYEVVVGDHRLFSQVPNSSAQEIFEPGTVVGLNLSEKNLVILP